MTRIFILAALMLSACQTGGPKDIGNPDWSLSDTKPGTVIHQSSRKLENDFYDVSKSIVNSSDHWEGIMHIGYIYHNKTEICQCGEYDTVISPNGKYIVYYSNEKGRLEIFNTASKKITPLSDKYMGYPETAEWDLKNKTAIIQLSAPNGAKNKELQISLE